MPTTGPRSDPGVSVRPDTTSSSGPGRSASSTAKSSRPSSTSGPVRRVAGPRRHPLGREVGEDVGEAQPRRQLLQLPDEQVREPARTATELDDVGHAPPRRGSPEPRGTSAARRNIDRQARVRVRDSRVAGDAMRDRRRTPDAFRPPRVEPSLVVPQRRLRQPLRRAGGGGRAPSSEAIDLPGSPDWRGGHSVIQLNSTLRRTPSPRASTSGVPTVTVRNLPLRGAIDAQFIDERERPSRPHRTVHFRTRRRCSVVLSIDGAVCARTAWPAR